MAVEAGLSLAGALLTSSATHMGDRQIQLGLTSLTIDSRQNVRRIIVGDTFAPRALQGPSPLVGGISIRSRFSIDRIRCSFPHWPSRHGDHAGRCRGVCQRQSGRARARILTEGQCWLAQAAPGTRSPLRSLAPALSYALDPIAPVLQREGPMTP